MPSGAVSFFFGRAPASKKQRCRLCLFWRGSGFPIAIVDDDSRFFEMLKGKTKKQLIYLLSKPNSKNKTGFTTKGTVGYVYCIDKTTIDNSCKICRKKCNPCKRSSKTLIVTNGFVIDIIGVYSGG
jgi:hypothetical protein